MKVMISLPMNGRKNDDIKERIKELKEKFAKLHIDVIDSFLTDEIEESYHPGVYYLGRTLTQFMHNVDAVYFDDGWEKARGCRIERKICEEYEILILDDEIMDTLINRKNGVQILPLKTIDYEPYTPPYKITCDNGEAFKLKDTDISNHIPKID